MTHPKASQAWQALRKAPVSSALWMGLLRHYVRQALPWHARYVAIQAQRCEARLGTETQRLLSQLDVDEPWLGGDQVLMQAAPVWPGLAQAMALLQAQVAADAGDWLSWLYLARCHELALPAGESTQMSPVLRDAVVHALACEPVLGETGHWLAVWRLRSGQAAGALAALQAVLQQAPGRFGSWLLQAEAHMHLGNAAAAEQSFARAGESQNPDFLGLLANTLFFNNYWEQALQVREAVVRLRPNHVESLLALGQLQSKVWLSEQAEQNLQRVLEMEPDNVEAKGALDDLHNSGVSRPQFDRALAAFEAQGVLNNGVGATRLLMQSLYQDHLSAEFVAQLHRRVGDALLADFAQTYPDMAQAATRPEVQAHGAVVVPAQATKRRLRVGYVSGDLHRQHPVNLFMLPVLKRHDHSRLEVFIYHVGTMHDEYTRQARACADHWREATKLDDPALHAMVQADQLDVLVDLAGHTSSHRLGVFAMRGAPVQMTYLGYPHSTGLRCFDWLIADRVVAPPEHERLFVERVARLPGSVFCWAPVDHDPLQADVLNPVQGPLVFGSFNNLLKLSDKTVALWARVLAAVPDSVLLVKAPVLRDEAVQAMMQQRFVAQGVDPGRLQFRGPTELSQMMQEYHDVHIALDPTPYNGGTTSLQALWMGCPMVTLEGANFVSRMGASFLRAMGRDDWVARDEADYVRIAAELAQQLRQKAWSRHAFRAQMLASPVCDIEAHTRHIEAVYEEAVKHV
ncbi:tetratricopeptide repeat protein [Limnohabitans sp. JirII-29]|uniref:O-linked N-acetylglucosamine transferase, SPINDLY family protein n=1 Tax=Limnohabitans sp. JirII-29 TaxID=1835756 RepID=UPI0013049564|nr:tetratricopeptide repeat protein [Limnohabitans sp. JirII-29]